MLVRWCGIHRIHPDFNRAIIAVQSSHARRRHTPAHGPIRPAERVTVLPPGEGEKTSGYLARDDDDSQVPSFVRRNLSRRRAANALVTSAGVGVSPFDSRKSCTKVNT